MAQIEPGYPPQMASTLVDPRWTCIPQIVRCLHGAASDRIRASLPCWAVGPYYRRLNLRKCAVSAHVIWVRLASAGPRGPFETATRGLLHSPRSTLFLRRVLRKCARDSNPVLHVE